MKMKKGFASDNWSGACPEIMEALANINMGHNEAYGELDDPITASAIEKFKQHFGEDIAVFFVYNGTAANVLGISQLMRSYHAVVTVGTAHLNEDECAALSLSPWERDRALAALTELQVYFQGKVRAAS